MKLASRFQTLHKAVRISLCVIIIIIIIIKSHWLRSSLTCSLPLFLSLSLSHHSSLSSITPYHLGWILCPYRVGRPTLCVGVLNRTWLMSLSLHLQQSPVCQVPFSWMVCEMGGSWPYSWCLEGCYFQDFFKIARSILVQFLRSLFSMRFLSVQLVHPYRSIDTAIAVLFNRIDQTSKW